LRRGGFDLVEAFPVVLWVSGMLQARATDRTRAGNKSNKSRFFFLDIFSSLVTVFQYLDPFKAS